MCRWREIPGLDRQYLALFAVSKIVESETGHAESVSTETGQRKRAKSHLNSIGIQWWSHSWGVSPGVVQEFESDFWVLNTAEIDCHVPRTRQYKDPGTLRARSFQSLKERKFALPYAAHWVVHPGVATVVFPTQAQEYGNVIEGYKVAGARTWGKREFQKPWANSTENRRRGTHPSDAGALPIPLSEYGQTTTQGLHATECLDLDNNGSVVNVGALNSTGINSHDGV
ncbi:hypothetical protein B0H13DRAFT_2457260 [Mycena leptocephala]|nr:hypothetical protein B0H13DRAFT_2457260 [Mycena leptocephala]